MRGGSQRPDSTAVTHATPTIVFHGDRDTTVDVNNGIAIVDQAVSNAERELGPLQKATHEGLSSEGRSYTTTTYRAMKTFFRATTAYRASKNATLVEYWVLHGAGHAWSGGFSEGSYTDESGPDASAEMIRFFLATGARR